MKLLALFLLVLGACIAYGAKKVLSLIFKKEKFTDEQIGFTKLLGFGIVLVAAIIVFML